MAILRIKDSSNAFIEIPALRGPQGVSGVYVGSGDMPEGYNVQIDPSGDIVEAGFATKDYVNNTVTDTANSLISSHNTNTNTHNDIRQQLSEISSEVEDLKLVITPEMYGAKGDGSNDDSTAIQSAIDAAGENAVVYLGKKTYKIGSTLNIHKSRIRFVCDGTLKYTGTDAAIKMYSMNMGRLDIYAIEAPNGTALLMDSTDGEVGSCIITINYIFSSVIGVHLKGDGGTGTTGHNIFYNKLHLEGVVSSTNTCIYIEPITALINENYFWIGRLYGGATYGIRVNARDGFGSDVTNGGAARNLFYGGNFEGLDSNGYSIHLHNSSKNVFRDFRTEEAYGKYVVGLSGECEGNDIGLSNIILSKVDISAFTDSGAFANILRSPTITGSASDNFTGQNKIWVTTDGFSSETSDIAKNLQIETWIFTLKDGTTVEKQVTIS